MPIVSIMGAKGGCGTSLIATNLALVLPRYGSSLLIDLNPRQGSDDLLINVFPTRSWIDLLPVADELTADHLAKVTVSHASGLQFLAAPATDLENLAEGRLQTLLQSIASHYTWVVIDLPGAVRQLVKETLDQTDLLFLVVLPDAPCLRSAKRLVKKLQRMQGPHIALVVNQISRNHPANPAIIAESLAVPLIASLAPDLRAIAYQVAFGQPCVLDHRSPFGRGVLRMAQRLLAFTQLAQAQENAQTRQNRFVEESLSRELDQ